MLEALEAATVDDLGAVDQQIAGHEQQLDRLRTLRKILAARFEPPKERKKRGPQRADAGEGGKLPKGAITQERRIAAAKYLMVMGPKSQTVIAADCNVPTGSMGNVVDCPWFERSGGLIHLTNEGRRAVDGKE